MADIELRWLWNHELDPDTRETLPESAVGAFVAYKRIGERKAYCLVPVSHGAREGVDTKVLRELAERQAEREFYRLALDAH